MPLQTGDHPVSADADAVSRLDASLGTLVAKGRPIAANFYQSLFAAHPSLRPLFPDDMSRLERKLIDSLVTVVGLLRKPSEAAGILREMGLRHRELGARPEHYPIVCRLLVHSMAQEFGELWTDQLAFEWFQVLELVSRHMIDAQGPQSR